MSEILREFIVTLRSKGDLAQFYQDMEGEGSSGTLPARAVECVIRRPISRNTHYKLSLREADELAKDPRVLAVTLKHKDMGADAVLHSSQTATWSRDDDTITVGTKNWGLYRCSLLENLPSWGSETASSERTATVNFTGSGKNVDIVVVDEIAYPSHSEFGSRYDQYDWFANHNSTVYPTNPLTNYQYYTTVPGDSYKNTNNHATHVSGIIAGATQGWARDANIYNINHDMSSQLTGTYTAYAIDYIRAFHNSKGVNPETGVKNPTLVNNSWGLGLRVNYTNPITFSGNSRFSKIHYRGADITAQSLGNAVVDTGYSGLCNTTTRIATLTGVSNNGTRFTSSDFTTGSSSSISVNLLGRTGISDLGAPTASSVDGVNEGDDAYWTIAPPFNISVLGATFGPTGTGGTNIYVSSNSYVMFGGAGTSAYAWFVGAGAPNVRKIHISAGDRSCQAVYAGVTGSTPNRTYRIRWEGHDGANGGVLNSPTTVWEMTFYETTPAQIDVHVGDNAAYRAEFTLSQLENYGILQTGYAAPFRDISIDADLEDAINDGVIFVGSSGNGGFKIDVPGGQDYDNYYVDNGEAIYYHRGATPGNSRSPTDDSDLNLICVGALDSTAQENKLQLGNTGPGVDLYAPGNNIMSSIYDPTGDTGGQTAGFVNDGSSAVAISTIARATNVATITTATAHNLNGGSLVTVRCTDNTTFNLSMSTVTITGSNTFTYPNTGSSIGTTSATGTVSAGYLYQKYNGSSMSTAQVTGLLAIALEEYPKMTQAEAKAYMLSHVVNNEMYTTSGGPTDATSLQGGNNRIAFYYKERGDYGNVFPKINYKIRPSTGMVFPRTRIKKS
jgi:hypothetical protein